MAQILIYGVTGYTGRLVLKEAIAKGLKPIIAGRNLQKTQKLALEFDLEFRIFSLHDVKTIASNIHGVTLVLHCAGPFAITARPMMEACLSEKVHYIDITGEIGIMQWAFERDSQAKEADIMLMCGVGFDLVPTDCVAANLKKALPDANSLEIGFYMHGGGISHGTMSTMAINLGNGSFERMNHELVAVPLAHKGKTIDFGITQKFCISIPWGDLFSAYLSTGIENITTYTAASKFTYFTLKIQKLLNPLFQSKVFKYLFQIYIDRFITGPSEVQNRQGRSYVWGKVKNASGETKEVILECAESYLLTALASVHIAKKILDGKYLAGYQTPSIPYGAELILEIEGSRYLK
jgi:short subunit dehydrogenase-like uncharacterized protein